MLPGGTIIILTRWIVFLILQITICPILSTNSRKYYIIISLLLANSLTFLTFLPEL